MQLGLTSFNELKKQTPVSRDAAANALVQKVGQRIAAVVGPDMPNAQWEFVVFESKEVNAFCLPGGKVGVYTGILPITKDEAGMATVLGHEIAHAVARHGGERMSEAMLMQTGGQLLNAGTASVDPRWQAVAQVAYGATTTRRPRTAAQPEAGIRSGPDRPALHGPRRLQPGGGGAILATLCGFQFAAGRRDAGVSAHAPHG